MKIKLLAIGKTDNKNLIQLIEEYQNRLKHYIKFELEIIVGASLVTVIFASFGLFLLIPTIIIEVLLLYKLAKR